MRAVRRCAKSIVAFRSAKGLLFRGAKTTFRSVIFAQFLGAVRSTDRFIAVAFEILDEDVPIIRPITAFEPSED